MNVVEALSSRITCRAYKPIQVDKKTLMKVMEAANYSPSWGNTQPWEIFIAQGVSLDRIREAYETNLLKNSPMNPLLARDGWPAPLKVRYQELMKMRLANAGIARDDKQGRLMEAFKGFKFFGAPVVAFLCMDSSLNDWSLFDLGLVAQSIMLAAEDNGLNTAVAIQFVAYTDVIRAELNIPEHLKIVIGISLGYGDLDHLDNRCRSIRRAIEEVVVFKND